MLDNSLPFTLQQRQNVYENAVDYVLNVGLLLKDHSGQVEQHLIAPILQL